MGGESEGEVKVRWEQGGSEVGARRSTSAPSTQFASRRWQSVARPAYCHGPAADLPSAQLCFTYPATHFVEISSVSFGN